MTVIDDIPALDPVHERYAHEVHRINRPVLHNVQCDDFDTMKRTIAHCYDVKRCVFSRSHGKSSLYEPSKNYEAKKCFDIIGRYKSCLLDRHEKKQKEKENQ